MINYLIITTLLMLLLSVFWKRDDGIDLIIKLILLIISIWGLFLVLSELGCLVKT